MYGHVRLLTPGSRPRMYVCAHDWLLQSVTKAAADAARKQVGDAGGTEGTEEEHMQQLLRDDDDEKEEVDDHQLVMDLLEEDDEAPLSAVTQKLIECYPDLGQFALELEKLTAEFSMSKWRSNGVRGAATLEEGSLGSCSSGCVYDRGRRDGLLLRGPEQAL